MRNTFPEIYICPGGAANYDITAATAGITQMKTALALVVGAVLFGRGAAYRLIGEVNCTNEEMEGSPSPSGQKAYLRTYSFVVGGQNLVADNTVMTTLLNMRGELKNVYLYDPYTQTDALVEQGLEGQVDITRNTTSLKVPAWNVVIKLGYVGADTREVIPNTYVA